MAQFEDDVVVGDGLVRLTSRNYLSKADLQVPFRDFDMGPCQADAKTSLVTL